MISRIAIALPDTVLTNDTLAALYPNWSAEKIWQKTGIRERRVAGPGECASDLAVRAAERLWEGEPREADFLLFCTQTPDYLLPTTACLLQHRLRLPTTCAALDFGLGCSGYVYGLALADALLRSGQAHKVLLLTADTYSKLIHPMDKSTRTIFGDAGSATLLSDQSPVRLHSFVFGTDGQGGEQLVLKTRGARHPEPIAGQARTDESGNVLDPNCLYMNGREVFNFTARVVPALVAEVLRRAGRRLEEIDFVVLHQANAFLLEHLRRRLNIPPEKFALCLEHCGNTVSSSIPLALEQLQRTGALRPGSKILLAGFGVGYSWAGCMLEWA